jgi:hypothetical protein
MQYDPAVVLPTRLTLIRATRMVVREFETHPQEASACWGWSAFSDRPVETYWIEGTHHTLLTPGTSAAAIAAIIAETSTAEFTSTLASSLQAIAYPSPVLAHPIPHLTHSNDQRALSRVHGMQGTAAGASPASSKVERERARKRRTLFPLTKRLFSGHL